MNSNFILVDNVKLFNDVYNEIREEPLLAIDTEFFRETSYFPHIGLIQIASSNTIYCIDPIAFDAKPTLNKLLLNKSTTKLFHACLQDLEVLYHYLGAIPCPVIDTQIATALLSEHDQIGYAKLVENHVGIQLDKSQTRTNWLKRPLTKKQLAYAADDVLYLKKIYEELVEALKNKNREAWFYEDCELLCENDQRFLPEINTSWQRVKGIYKLKGQQFCIAHAVALWREKTAIKKDYTRKRVLPDEIILQLAVAQPESLDELNKHNVIHKWLSESEIRTLYPVIQQALNQPREQWPAVETRKPTPDEKKQLKMLVTRIDEKSSLLGIASSLLCSRKDAEKLVYGERNLPVLKGWRLECIGNELLGLIKKTKA